jgi:ribosome biogenesis GTPase
LIDLSFLGWKPFFEQQTRPEGSEHWFPGRVINEERGLYRVHCGKREWLAELPGRWRYEGVSKGELPAVGDWVYLEHPKHSERGIVRWRLDRFSHFSRKRVGEVQQQVVAANIDTLLIVMSLNQDFNLRRLERYLVMAWESQLNPVILLTKADLSPNSTELAAEVEGVAWGVPTHIVSVLHDEGMEPLEAYLQPGQTLALVGSSGVGKSTLLNYWMQDELQDTGGVRGGDDKGKHTTTSRTLFFLRSGAMVIDTPGMRELQLWNSEEGFKNAFSDIEQYTEHCRFRDCTHQNEPGCGILAALEEGVLTEERLQSYRKLQRELAYLERKQDKEAQRNERRKWKAISVQAKVHSRIKKQGGW